MSEDFLYFKFRAINKRLIESLVDKSLYFAKPDILNDPYDCQLDLRKSWIRAASSATGIRATMLKSTQKMEKLLEKWGKKFENIGVCAFSLNTLDSEELTLMWTHYADEHKGVCLLYRFTEQFLVDVKNRIIGVDTVNYKANGLTKWLAEESPEDQGEFIKELTKLYLTIKNPAWKYEKEARIIRFEHGPFKLSYEALEQVCFGLRTPQADIDLITKLASQYSGCKKFCRMRRDEKSDFGVTVEELS